MEEIPYLYTNEKDIFPKSLGMYIYQNGFERMGIKSIYYGGGERHETAIYYTKPVTGIEEVKNGQWTMDNAVYDLSGRRVQEPKRGLYILNGKKFIVK